MLYKEEIHSFNKFIERWNPGEEYVLYGASKDCVQLIETLDIILTENNKLKIKYIVDDYIKDETNYNNIYDISEFSYKPDNIIKPNNRKNLSVVKFSQFLKDSYEKKLKIIITSDANYNKIRENLLSQNYQENIDFCNYKQIAAIWPFKLENKTHLWRSDILLTEKCTLNCTYCNMYMPHYKNPKHRELKDLVNDFDLYFKAVDYVSIFHLVGGEPLMVPFVDEVIEHIGSKYRNKIGRLLLTTNGTLVPKKTTFDLFKKYCLLVSISNYTDSINYGRKLSKFIESLKKDNIAYFVRSEIEWDDFGDPNEIKFFSDKEIIEHFDKCTAPYRGVNQGKYFYCHLNTSAILAGMENLNEDDYILLDDNLNKEDLLKFDLGFLPKGYATFCKKCNGCNTGINIPVKPRDQGLRH